MSIINIIIIALIGEAIWETAKMTWQTGKVSIDRIGAMIVGILLALGTQYDLFNTIGTPMKIPYLGMVFTGILVSRGANYLHDLMGKIEKPAEPKA